jgi:hypothetical protein
MQKLLAILLILSSFSLHAKEQNKNISFKVCSTKKWKMNFRIAQNIGENTSSGHGFDRIRLGEHDPEDFIRPHRDELRWKIFELNEYSAYLDYDQKALVFYEGKRFEKKYDLNCHSSYKNRRIGDLDDFDNEKIKKNIFEEHFIKGNGEMIFDLPVLEVPVVIKINEAQLQKEFDSLNSQK